MSATGRFGPFGREVLAGLNSLPLLFPLATAAGVIAYSPLGPDYAMRGAVAGMVCAAIGGLMAAFVRSSSGLVMTNSTSFVSVQASLLGTIIAAIGPNSALHLAALPLLVLLTGIAQIALGGLGAARLVKFVPFPVVSGFISGVGVLLLLKFGPAILGVGSLRDVSDVLWGLRTPNVAIAAFTVGLLAVSFLVRRIMPRAPAIMIALLVGIAVYQVALMFGRAAALGRVVGAEALSTLWTSPFSTTRWLADVDLTALLRNREACLAIALSVVTLAVIGVLDTVLATRSAQNITDFPASPRRDMVGLGAANIVSAFIGAAGLSTSTPQSAANYRAGGRTRWSIVVLSTSLLAALVAIPGAIAAVPLSVFPPLIIVVAWLMIDPYTFAIIRRAFAADDSNRAQARRNALIHYSVLLPTALNQPLIGVGVGVLLSSIVFIVSMGRPIVRRVRDGRSVASRRVRARGEREVLTQHGAAIVLYDLEGPLFFGNAEDLADSIKRAGEARIVVLNLRGVTDIDATGVKILEQIDKSLAAAGRLLIVAQVPQRIETTVQDAFDRRRWFGDIDDALEHAENILIEQQASAAGTASAAGQPAPLRLADFDVCQGAAAQELETLETFLRHESFAAGATLCREGDVADRLWMIRLGAVSVRVGGHSVGRRIAAFGPGTTVGEMAMIEGKPRSASVIVDESVEAFVLTREAYGTLMSEHPGIGSLLFQNISRDLSRRLRQTSDDLRAALA